METITYDGESLIYYIIHISNIFISFFFKLKKIKFVAETVVQVRLTDLNDNRSSNTLTVDKLP